MHRCTRTSDAMRRCTTAWMQGISVKHSLDAGHRCTTAWIQYKRTAWMQAWSRCRASLYNSLDAGQLCTSDWMEEHDMVQMQSIVVQQQTGCSKQNRLDAGQQCHSWNVVQESGSGSRLYKRALYRVLKCDSLIAPEDLIPVPLVHMPMLPKP